MKRKIIVRIHIVATVVATVTIATFFLFSLAAEVKGEETFIKKVKQGILYSLPLLIVAMPILKITGNKLAGKSQNAIVLAKQKRMKFVLLNGIALLSLACFLYYRSRYQTIDGVFIMAQVAELLLGLANLVLIGLNTKGGFQLSGRLKKQKRKAVSNNK